MGGGHYCNFLSSLSCGIAYGKGYNQVEPD